MKTIQGIQMTKKKGWMDEFLLTLPSFSWLFVFFLVPTFIVFCFAFKPSNIYGGVNEGWTLENIYKLANPNYLILIYRTLWLGMATTTICITLALPIGYFLARARPRIRQFVLLLIVIPFWSSFIIRIFAWKSILHPEGMLKEILVALQIVNAETQLLYNSGAVLLVMVYTYLPFGILPIFAAASKFDFQLLEAGMDLGATRFKAFNKIFIPGIKKGILTATAMVFIPALGAYIIPDLVGGSQSEMIGNKIAQRTLVDRNLPQASALSALLAASVLLPTLIITLLQSRAKKLKLEAHSRE
jgi:spermidine/putrescine transport system permease protein